uniref:Collagen type VI alpha 6 chain n=1 Tax=Oreochromis niloticus TaxID=8128 RepID=A0A669EYG4_ORENI
LTFPTNQRIGIRFLVGLLCINDVKCLILAFSLAACNQTDLVFLLDYSSSINQSQHTIMLNFTASVVDNFNVSKELAHVGLAQFSDDPKDEFYLNTYNNKTNMTGHILNMPYNGGNTYLGEALVHIRDYFHESKGSRRDVPKNLVLITDGNSHDDVEDAAEALRKMGITIFAIAVGDVFYLQLLQITGTPEKVFNVDSFDSLILPVSVLMSCRVAETSGSFHCAPNCLCCFTAVADIVFLVDGSWSIGAENFEQIRQFLFTLVNSFDVSPDHVRIGLVQYSDNPLTEFLLNTFDNKEDILNNIIKLPYRGGGTLTGKGLEFMLNEHFVGKAGSRAVQKVPQIAVVITDGKSQDDVESHAKNLRRRGIVLYAIGIKDADASQLREIANDDQHVYSVSDFAALQGISQNIIQTLCTTVEEAKRQLLQLSQGKPQKVDSVHLDVAFSFRHSSK